MAILVGNIKGPAGPPGPQGEPGADGISGSYATTVGDGTNSVLTVTHPLSTMDVLVQVYDIASGQTCWPVILRLDAGSILLDFGDTVPAVDSFRVCVIR